jgi:hypothetical protein
MIECTAIIWKDLIILPTTLEGHKMWSIRVPPITIYYYWQIPVTLMVIWITHSCMPISLASIMLTWSIPREGMLDYNAQSRISMGVMVQVQWK